MTTHMLTPGTTVELTGNADTIPAGTYTFVRRYDELLVLSVSSEVGFVLASPYWAHLVQPARPGARVSSEAAFCKKYVKLLETRRSGGDSSPQGAIAVCFMGSKALARASRHLCREHGDNPLLKLLKPQRAPLEAAA